MNNIQEHSNFLTEAAQLLNDTAVNIESQIEISKEKGIGKQQQELAYKIQDDAMKTLKQKGLRVKKEGKSRLFMLTKFYVSRFHVCVLLIINTYKSTTLCSTWQR